MTEVPPVLPVVDTSRPSAARIYDFMLGGCHNFPVDRAAAAKVMDVVPEFGEIAWANRGFHQRAARLLATTYGIRQFIDIGSGLPTQGNTHEVLVGRAPDARVVYVDNDPMVLAFAKGFLADNAAVSVIHGDLRDPDGILDHPNVRALIRLGEPVGLLMTAVLNFVSDDDDPWHIVNRYVDALAPGSYLVISHVTPDNKPPLAVAVCRDVYARSSQPIYPRSKADITRFFDGLEIVPAYPGAGSDVVHTGVWGAESVSLADSDGSRWIYCGVARCP
jgi:hypothetical protein